MSAANDAAQAPRRILALVRPKLLDAGEMDALHALAERLGPERFALTVSRLDVRAGDLVVARHTAWPWPLELALDVRRLGGEGLQAVFRMREGTVPVVWRVGPYEAGRMGSRPALHFAMSGLSEAEGAAFVEALLPAWLWLSPGSPLLAPCPEGTDDDRANVAPPLRRLHDRMRAWSDALGPNPWTPLYTLWSEGYRLEAVTPRGLVLACDGLPLARAGRANRAHG